MAHRINGVSGFGFGIQWERSVGDADVATAVIRYMEDRRLLFGLRFFEDAQYCVLSALDARQFLTTQLGTPGLGRDLVSSLQALRAAFRKFVDDAGPEGVSFRTPPGHLDPFSVALGALRGAAGLHLATIAYHYEIPVEDDLASIFPVEDDPSWVPGFGQND